MNQPTAPPGAIYIIRHGEKPADPARAVPGQPAPFPAPPIGVDFQGDQNAHSLLPQGWQRSGALAALFDPATGPAQAGLQTPMALLSPFYGDPGDTAAHRTYQTIQGLAGRLGLPITSAFAEGQEAQLAASVVSGSSGVVLICWEHDHIPSLAAALPVVPGTAIPQEWPGGRFDVIWTFTLVPGTAGSRYTFGQVPQQLLPGDASTVIAVWLPELITGMPSGAVDMRVHAGVVQRAGRDRHRDRARAAAAHGPFEITALPGGDTADNQPDDEKQRSDVHLDLRGNLCIG